MFTLPDTAQPYRTIGPFTQDSLPTGLLREHNTKDGVWGLLEVLEGAVKYVITEPGEEAEHLLSSALPGVIAPQQKHHLILIGDVTFQIRFHRVHS